MVFQLPGVLNAADRLAVDVAIASLDMLKDAARDLGCPIEQLTREQLSQWMRQTGRNRP